MSKFEIPNNNAEQVLKNEKEQRKQRIIILSKEIVENQERLSFPGINPYSYDKLRSDDDEFPGFVTPIDELIQRFKDEGMKLMLGKNPESGNVFFLPYGSDDEVMDSVLPKHLEVSDDMDAKIKELILISRI